jgi:hypothetical protein
MLEIGVPSATRTIHERGKSVSTRLVVVVDGDILM